MSRENVSTNARDQTVSEIEIDHDLHCSLAYSVISPPSKPT